MVDSYLIKFNFYKDKKIFYLSNMEYNSDFQYDLHVGQVKEKELGDILNNKTIEVKHDLHTHVTGNVFVEYKSRNQSSGISTTVADYYCIAIQDSFTIIPTKILKEKCRKYLGTNRDVIGGDNQTSKGILLPVTELF